jgi:hypothetical protein
MTPSLKWPLFFLYLPISGESFGDLFTLYLWLFLALELDVLMDAKTKEEKMGEGKR